MPHLCALQMSRNTAHRTPPDGALSIILSLVLSAFCLLALENLNTRQHCKLIEQGQLPKAQGRFRCVWYLDNIYIQQPANPICCCNFAFPVQARQVSCPTHYIRSHNYSGVGPNTHVIEMLNYQTNNDKNLLELIAD